MAATRRREVARTLRRARELMNDGGAHWIKGALSRRKKDGDLSYCMVGGILAAHGVERLSSGWSNNPRRIPKDARPALIALAEAIKGGRPYWLEGQSELTIVDWAVGEIEMHNDSSHTKWEDVSLWLKEAISACKN